MPLDFSCFVRRVNVIVRLYSYASHTLRFADAGGSVPSLAAISQPSAPKAVVADDEGPTPVLQESSI